MMRYLTIMAAGLVAISMAGEAAAFCRSFGKNHSNGGGWVTSSATVDDTVYVGPEAEVCDKAQVTGNAVVVHSWVNGKAKVSGNAQIKNSNVGGFNRMSSPHVYGNAKIDGAQILHSAKIYGNAVVDGAQVRDAANVYGNAKVTGIHTMVRHYADVFGTAVVRDGADIQFWGKVSGNAVVGRGATISDNGKVDCGIWENIIVKTDRRGECGYNGKPRVSDLLDTPLDMSNTQSTDLQEWGTGELLSNPLNPENTHSTE